MKLPTTSVSTFAAWLDNKVEQSTRNVKSAFITDKALFAKMVEHSQGKRIEFPCVIHVKLAGSVTTTYRYVTLSVGDGEASFPLSLDEWRNYSHFKYKPDPGFLSQAKQMLAQGADTFEGWLQHYSDLVKYEYQVRAHGSSILYRLRCPVSSSSYDDREAFQDYIVKSVVEANIPLNDVLDFFEALERRLNALYMYEITQGEFPASFDDPLFAPYPIAIAETIRAWRGDGPSQPLPAVLEYQGMTI